MKKLLIIIAFISGTHSMYSQNFLRSTMSMSGRSSLITIDDATIRIHQSIGQSGAIGTFQSDNHLVRQGFIQPFDAIDNISVERIVSELQVRIYPNPFENHIDLEFDEQIGDDVHISIFDLQGKIIHTRIFPADQNIRLSLPLIPAGSYWIYGRTGKKEFTATLLKQ